MTILALYPVWNEMGFGRRTFDIAFDDTAFEMLWCNRQKCGVIFFDMESHAADMDTYDLECSEIFCSDEFEDAYNNEVFDGGWWAKVLHVPSDDVMKIIKLNQ